MKNKPVTTAQVALDLAQKQIDQVERLERDRHFQSTVLELLMRRIRKMDEQLDTLGDQIAELWRRNKANKKKRRH